MVPVVAQSDMEAYDVMKERLVQVLKYFLSHIFFKDLEALALYFVTWLHKKIM